MLKTISAYSPTKVVNFKAKKQKLKKYALKTALKSDYARRTYDVLPTWIVSYVLRNFVDFVLYYRIITQYYLLNLGIAIIISIMVTMASPFFYDVVWQYKGHIQKFTDHIVNHMSWNYYFTWRNRFVLIAASVVIMILYMDWIIITNWWVIECIIHTLVCGFILGKYDEVRNYITKPKVMDVHPFDYDKEARAAMHFIKPVHIPLRQVRYANVNINDNFMRHNRYKHTPSSRAKKVVIRAGIIHNTKVIQNAGIIQNINIFGGMNLISDYSPKK
jgi:hypothetical protein